MGCDIHWRFERRAEGTNEPWEVVRGVKFDAYRSYITFEALAGVRSGYGDGPIPTFSEPRGLPEDLAKREPGEVNKWGELYTDDYEFGDHSFSWVGYKELSKFWSENKEALIDTYIHPLVHMMEGLNYDSGKWYDVRFVFGFDS